MLKKINRGLGKKDFDVILSRGKTIQTPLFGVRFGRSETLNFGWIVSKKISKLAVVRNKIKRKLAEAVASQLKEKEAMSLKMIFLVKKNIIEASVEDIKKDVKYVFEKISS